jgi:hypothetical protein
MEREDFNKGLANLLKSSKRSFILHLLKSSGRNLIPKNVDDRQTFEEILLREGISGVYDRTFHNKGNPDIPTVYRLISDEEQAIKDRNIQVGGFYIKDGHPVKYTESRLIPLNSLYDHKEICMSDSTALLLLLMEKHSHSYKIE